MSVIQREGVTGVTVGLANKYTSYLIIYDLKKKYDYDAGYDEAGMFYTSYPIERFFSRGINNNFNVNVELFSYDVYPVYSVASELVLWSEGKYVIEKGGIDTVISVPTIEGINFVKGAVSSLKCEDILDIINSMVKDYMIGIKVTDNIRCVMSKEMVDSIILSDIIYNALVLVGVSNIYSHFNYNGKIYTLKLVDNIDIEDEILRDKDKIYSHALGAITTSILGWNDNQDLSDN